MEHKLHTIKNKLFFYIGEIKALKDGGVWYFIGFGILLFVLIPFLIIDILILLLFGKDMGWFQSAEYVEKEMVININEIPQNLRHLVPLAKKWGIGDDGDRGEFMELATKEDLDELEEMVGPNMQAISDWLSSYPEDSYNDTTYYFTYLMSAYDETGIYK